MDNTINEYRHPVTGELYGCYEGDVFTEYRLRKIHAWAAPNNPIEYTATYYRAHTLENGDRVLIPLETQINPVEQS